MPSVNLRTTLRRVVDCRGLSLVRFFIWNSLARKDARATNEMARRFGIAPLDIYAKLFQPSTGTKTLFILGSGDSVRDLSRGQLATIASGHSIGVNFWLFHDFVPSAYSFDAGRTANSPADPSRLRAVGRHLDRPEVTAANPVAMYLRPVDQKEDSLFPVPPVLGKGAKIYGRANLVTESLRNLPADLRMIIRALRWKLVPSTILPDNGSSVVRLIFLAVAMRYTDVVLVGVDLDARPHFFFHEDYASVTSEVIGHFTKPSGVAHETTETTHRPFDTRVFIDHLAKIINKAGSSRVWLASDSSALSASMPVYPWPKT